VVVPSAKVLPEAGTHDGVIEPSTMSRAEAGNDAVAPEGPVASLVMSAGTVTAGGVVSCTTMGIDCEAEVLGVGLLWSEAVQVIVCEPIERIVPDAILHDTVGDGSTMSVAVVVYDIAAPLGPVASTGDVPVRVKVGGVVSTTVAGWNASAMVTHEELLPQEKLTGRFVTGCDGRYSSAIVIGLPPPMLSI